LRGWEGEKGERRRPRRGIRGSPPSKTCPHDLGLVGVARHGTAAIVGVFAARSADGVVSEVERITGQYGRGSVADGYRPVAAERHAQVVNDAVGAVLLIPESKFYIAPNFLCFLLHCFCSTFKLDVISYTKFFDGIEYFQLGKSLVKSLVAYTNKL